jgi:hypothetical protein
MDAQVRYWASLHGICGGHSSTWSGFSPSTSLFPVNIIPLMLRTHLHLKTKETNKQAKAWELSKKAKQNIKEHGQKSKFFLRQNR